jgi:2-polyprenyl-3-methyl-5-hydroxy-6-metoxy-1,4-benzoquinol methylase
MTDQTTKMWWQHIASPIKLRYLQKFALGKTALDLGTGAGHYAHALIAQGFSVIGLDLEPRLNLPYPTIQARLNAIPLNESFDTVLAFDILEHEADEAAALAEIRRITKKRLLLSVPNADDSLLTPYNLTYKHHIDKTHQREYEINELRQKLTQAGFHIIAIHKEGRVSPAVLSEFVSIGFLRRLTRVLLKGLAKLKILKSHQLLADIYVVAEPVEG